MKNCKVLVSGVSSFTGCYIAKAFVDAGAEVWGLLSKKSSDYVDPLQKKRLEFSGVARFIEEAPFGSEKLFRACEKKVFEIFVSHGAAIQGYRSPDFDYLKSVTNTLSGVRELYALFGKQKLKGIVHSGTVFEPVDGLGAVSPYGLSKAMVWNALEYFSELNSLSLSKVWIPNPIGVFENEDRLLPIFAKQWKEGKTPKLTAPRIVYDHVPASWLANFYVKAAQDMRSSNMRVTKHYRPSAFVLDNEELVNSLRGPMEKILGKKLEVEISNASAAAPAIRRNREACPELASQVEYEKFWSDYARYWS